MYGFLYFHRLKEEKTAEKEEESEEESNDADLNFNKDEIQKMREMARKLSQKIGQDKVTKLLQGSDVKQGSSDSGSDSKEPRSAKNTDSDSRRNISKTHVKENSYGTIATDMNKLKHFRIKKKPTASSSLEKPVEAVTDATKPLAIEGVKTGASSSRVLKRKSSSEQDDARDKHKKKKHKKKDASQCFFPIKKISIYFSTNIKQMGQLFNGTL